MTKFLSDEDMAEDIRHYLKHLSAAVERAKEAGLSVSIHSKRSPYTFIHLAHEPHEVSISRIVRL